MLYSPAGASDSSGFSEQRDSSGSSFTCQPYPHQNQLYHLQKPLHQNHHYSNLPTLRNGNKVSGSSLHFQPPPERPPHLLMQLKQAPNATSSTSSSAFSTLPRRPPGIGIQPGQLIHQHSPLSVNGGPQIFGGNSAGASYIGWGRNSPLLLELIGDGASRQMTMPSTGRHGLVPGNDVIVRLSSIAGQKVEVRSPLLEDDRESCV